MGLLAQISRLLLGPAAEIEAQAAAQRAQLLTLPAIVPIGPGTITLRRLQRGDGDAILEFARALAPHDLLFLRRDITQPDQVDDWINEIEEGYAISVGAFDAVGLAGYATVSRDHMTWTAHVAELRVLAATRMRGKGLGWLLTEQAFAIAREMGIRKMMAQMTTDQVAAVAVFKRMGFEPEAVLRNQVLDRDGRLHDLQIMSLDVDAFRAKVNLARASVESHLLET
ncbi:MAG: GNAT family protein [Chloroflexi bacterium]|nr:GNAT family protein [Chloroflexota bacterium]